MHENIKANTKYSLHTHTDTKSSRCYLVPFDSNGAFDDAICVDDPIVLEGKITITSDIKGRKIIEVTKK